MIQCLHTTTLKHKTPLTFILHTQLLSKNDSFFYAQQTSFDQQNHPSSSFTSPSQQLQTQTSNQNEHPIANEHPII